MTEEKKRTATVLAVVLVVAILCSLCASLYSAKGIYDLKTEANAAQETTETALRNSFNQYAGQHQQIFNNLLNFLR